MYVCEYIAYNITNINKLYGKGVGDDTGGGRYCTRWFLKYEKGMMKKAKDICPPRKAWQ